MTVTATVLPASCPRSARSAAKMTSKLVSGPHVAFVVHRYEPVRVAVEGEAEIGAALSPPPPRASPGGSTRRRR